MNLKSELMSSVLKILLGVLITLSVMDLIGTIVYSNNVNFYLDYIYSINNFILLIKTVLYYVIVVIYLIWIYRVHMDLNNLFVNYSRSPGMSLVCMMVPFFNFYGLPSTYLRIGKYYRQETTGLERQGQWIRGLIITLILCFIVLSRLNWAIKNAEGEPGIAYLFATGITELITYSIFLYLCILVSQGVKQIHSHKIII
jgi:hypothetical protein